jgi:acyl-CoA synthetase (AMP-forming)/AMP-acid ligase II/thioesterase domain-containing protein
MSEAPGPLQVGDLIRRNAQNAPSAPALISVDREVIPWQQLLAQVERTRATLSAFGLGDGDCVALLLPNGPLLAQTFLSVVASATCAPLNLAYSSAELAFYLRNLGARAIIISEATPKSTIEVALRAGIKILKIQSDRHPCGMFELVGEPSGETNSTRRVTPDSVALLLHTSGTTASPKLVPLRHGSLMTSVHDTAAWLQLAPGDCCLNVMPLFHIHGLIGGLLSALANGGSSVCPPDFQPAQFLRWLKDSQATWYTAVPTMHRAIVDRAAEHAELVSSHPLRFIRSCSAPLPPTLLDELVRTFNVPIVEAYGMTEAAHQIASNPLPPAVQKPGTVGLPAGPEISIMNEAGTLLEAGAVGEVVIRGRSVIAGYQDNAAANSDSFDNGWFRTGDLGRFDQDGYLTLVGRLKDQVNKGGMKISPLEVDEALLNHPGVSQAAAFGVPHPTLGETIAAAVVLRPGATTTSADLRRFLRGHLAQFKIPHRILLLDQLPKGATGKLQRRHLSEVFQSQAPAPSQVSPPEDRLEMEIATIWSTLLKREHVDCNDDFFEIGGDSLLAVQMLLEVERLTGQPLPKTILFDAPTVRQLARRLNSMAEPEGKPLIEVQRGSGGQPFIFFHGNYTHGGYYTRRMCKFLDPRQRFITAVPHGLGGEPLPQSIEEMAAERLPMVLEIQPRGPFRLGGYCSGGLVAFELARLLTKAGHRVEFVAMVDTPTFNARPIVRALRHGTKPVLRLIRAHRGSASAGLGSAIDTVWRFASKAECLTRTPPAERWKRISASLRRRVADGSPPASVSEGDWLDKLYTERIRKYVPAPLAVPVVFFSAEYRGHPLRHLTPNLAVINIPGGHIGCVTTELETLAGHMVSLLHHGGSGAVAEL